MDFSIPQEIADYLGVLDQFIEMLRDSTMNFTILSVLRAICSCQGKGKSRLLLPSLLPLFAAFR